MAAVGAIIHAAIRRGRGDESAGTWIVFLAVCLLAVPLAGAVAVAYCTWTIRRARRAARDRPPRPSPPVGSIPAGALPTRGRRFAAALLDAAVVGVPLTVLALTVSHVDLQAGVIDTPSWVRWIGGTVVPSYHIVSVAGFGRTVGQLLLGLRVLDIDAWARPRPRAAVLRAFPVLMALIPYIGQAAVLAYVPILWRADQRGLHDLAAGTVVVRVRV